MASSTVSDSVVSKQRKCHKLVLPVWIDDSHLDPQWIRTTTGLPAVSCTAVDMSNKTRRGTSPAAGATVRLLVELESQKPQLSSVIRLVLKQVPDNKSALDMSRRLGLAREALFYAHLAPTLSSSQSSTALNITSTTGSAHHDLLPKIYYAAGN
jgi:hypothetical protein